MAEHVSKHCREIFEQISDFIDGEIQPDVCAEIERHIQGCSNCDNFIDSVKKTVALYQKDKEQPMPEEARSRLHAALEEKCKELKSKIK